MRYLLTLLNVILATILLYILIYPKIQAGKVVEARILFEKDISALPLYIAEEKGFFDSLKIKVTIEETYKSGEEFDEIAKTTAHLGSGIPWSTLLFKSAARPKAVRLILSMESTISEPYDAIFVKKERLRRKRIRKYKDFEGKRLGFPRGTMYDLLLKYFLQGEGVNVDRIVFVPVSQSEMDSAIQNNLVDILLAVEPARSILMGDKSVELFEDAFLEKHLITPFPVGAHFTSLANVNLNKRIVKRLQSALNMAVDVIRTNPEEALNVAKKYLEIPENLELNLFSFKKYDEMDQTTLERFSKLLYDAGVVLFEVPVSEMFLKPEEIR
jgi:ABC-type nitrate/sulfonate/bicarbonate transport system substrate-binding protein